MGETVRILAGSIAVLAVLFTAGHVILYKRDSRAAIGWVGLVLLVPLLGACLYLIFGVNRIQRRAVRLRAAHLPEQMGSEPGQNPTISELHGFRPAMEQLARLVGHLTGEPLLAGNRVSALGSEGPAQEAMLSAIENAEHTIGLSTYIFDNDPVGRTFAEALVRAVKRGVAVRVLIDGVGLRYSFPTILPVLHRGGVPTALFGPTFLPWRFPYLNLRNHRKLLVVDGRLAFTGGLNLRSYKKKNHFVRDLHCSVEGPVVEHLAQTFRLDWLFCTGERLSGTFWHSAVAHAGPVSARGVADGPDEDFEKIRWAIQGALACAEQSVRIMTPYFLPDATLISGLNLAVMRGVSVEIVLPRQCNLLMVQWASNHLLWQVLERGCRVYFSPPPFDHTKLMVIDGFWTFLGSANWDARSLRLNFEFNLECYDRTLAQAMERFFENVKAQSRETTLAEMDARPLPVRLRDGFARLFSPYL